MQNHPPLPLPRRKVSPTAATLPGLSLASVAAEAYAAALSDDVAAALAGKRQHESDWSLAVLAGAGNVTLAGLACAALGLGRVSLAAKVDRACGIAVR